MKIKRLKWNEKYGSADSLVGHFVQMFLILWFLALPIVSGFIVENIYKFLSVKVVTGVEIMALVAVVVIFQMVLIVVLQLVIFDFKIEQRFNSKNLEQISI